MERAADAPRQSASPWRTGGYGKPSKAPARTTFEKKPAMGTSSGRPAGEKVQPAKPESVLDKAGRPRLLSGGTAF